MAPAHRGRPGVRIAAPKSNLIKAVNSKRAIEASAAASKSKRPEREPVAVDAPPLSSSDDEEEDISDTSAVPPPSQKCRQSGDGNQEKEKRRPGLLIAADRHKSSGGGDSSDGSSNQRGTKRRRPREKEEENEAASIQNVTNTHGSLFARPVRPTLKATYGGRKTTYSSESQTTQRSTSMTATMTTTITTTRSSSQPSVPVFKTYQGTSSDVSDVSEPEEPEEKSKKTVNGSKPSTKDARSRKWAASSADPKSSPPPKTMARFIKPPELTPERERSAEEAEKRKTTPPKKFKPSKYAMSDDEQDGARASNEKIISTKSTATKSKSDTKAANKSTATDNDSRTDVKSIFKSRQHWRQNLEKKTMGKGSKNGKTSQFGQLEVEKQALPPPPKAVFKVPVFDSFKGKGNGKDSPDVHGDGNVHDIHDLSDDDDDAIDNDTADASDDTPAAKGPAICPLCKAPLDEDVLRDLLAGHHLLVGIAVGRSHVVQLNLLKFDEKVRFCRGHKQHDSRAAWTARGYPVIDWAALPARLLKYEEHVKDVILGTTPSPFRVAWESTAFSASSLSAPGYYGRRGLRVLSEAIVQRHASTLSRRAIEEPLLAARGMVQFVQAVLVPELAVQLIHEDLQAVDGGAGGGKAQRSSSLDEARRVLRESAAIGEEVMDEERDVIEDDDDEDEDEDQEDGKDEEDFDSDAMSM
ncbi:hypothetical protein SBRCBS47491_002296 [Sporothrix bragantina]|uniref:Restriction of telomere capping protein 4 n=1 Tax=Sporothrix bragantina TaxID=671064 RepID=A0ABP0B6M8_9PEZI